MELARGGRDQHSVELAEVAPGRERLPQRGQAEGDRAAGVLGEDRGEQRGLGIGRRAGRRPAQGQPALGGEPLDRLPFFGMAGRGPGRRRLRTARDPRERGEELGDLLFALVSVARKLDLEAEAGLRAANDKFRGRFRTVERLAAERGVALRDLDFEALDELWNAAKAEERAAAAAEEATA